MKKHEGKRIAKVWFNEMGNEYNFCVDRNCSKIVYENNYCGDHSAPFFEIWDKDSLLRIIYETFILQVIFFDNHEAEIEKVGK